LTTLTSRSEIYFYFSREGVRFSIRGSVRGGRSTGIYPFVFCDCGYIKDIKEKKDEDLLVLPTDAALFEDPSFKVSSGGLFRGYYNSIQKL